MQIIIPTTEEIRAAVRSELADFFSLQQFKTQPEPDETGGVEFAAKITGLAITTIYTKASLRQIPHSKPEGSKKLIFSRRDLEKWMRDGKRRTASEIKAEALAI
jgi:predicted DNA-binding transcriptional regulator AlpA